MTSITCLEIFLSSGLEYFFNKDACTREWGTYLTDPSNGVSEHSEKILRHLRALQMAASIDEVDRLMENIPPEEDWLKSVEFSGDGFWISEYQVPVIKNLFFSLTVLYIQLSNCLGGPFGKKWTDVGQNGANAVKSIQVPTVVHFFTKWNNYAVS